MAEGDSPRVRRWLGVFALGRDDEEMASGELTYDLQPTCGRIWPLPRRQMP
jgi:hypothetical protein